MMMSMVRGMGRTLRGERPQKGQEGEHQADCQRTLNGGTHDALVDGPMLETSYAVMAMARALCQQRATLSRHELRGPRVWATHMAAMDTTVYGSMR